MKKNILIFLITILFIIIPITEEIDATKFREY